MYLKDLIVYGMIRWKNKVENYYNEVIFMNLKGILYRG